MKYLRAASTVRARVSSDASAHPCVARTSPGETSARPVSRLRVSSQAKDEKDSGCSEQLVTAASTRLRSCSLEGREDLEERPNRFIRRCSAFACLASGESISITVE